MSLRPARTLAALLPLALALAAPLAAQQQAGSSSATELRSLGIQRAAGPIRIDGNLDDPGWVGATRVTGFVERTPREGAVPPASTEVLVTYDETNLYVAFIAQDPDPDRIRATLLPRDRLWSDDWVAVLLDPHGDAAMGYYFLANPIGVQADMQLTPRSEDSSIDFIYHTSGRITDEGFIVEMAIPFRSLRVPAREAQDWGIMFVRSYPRSTRHYITWPAWSRNSPCQICELARLDGIEGITTGGNLEVLPSLVLSQAGQLQNRADPGSFERGRVQTHPSLGLKYSIQRGWTAEATINPDFSQVESDAAQIDVNTTFAIFYPERRPFFQEGMDLYQLPINVFYSRSINAPQVATKLTGRAGRTSIGYIGARDEHTPFVIPFEERTAYLQAGRSFTNALRLQQNLGSGHVGTLLTDRRMDGGGSGTAVSVDGEFRFREAYSLTGHMVVSHTQEPDDPELSARLPNLTFGPTGTEHTAAFDGESYTGRAALLRLARNARLWSWNAQYFEASPTYRSDVGFRTQNDFRRLTGWTGLNFYPNRPNLVRVSPGANAGTTWNFRGESKESWVSPQISATLPWQTNLTVGGLVSEETFRGTQLSGIRDLGVWVSTSPSAALRMSFNASTGRRVARNLAVPEVGSGHNLSLAAAIQPLPRLLIEPSLSYQTLGLDDGTELFAGYIARTRFNVQFTREMHLRTVVQYNEFSERLDVEPLLVYQLNPFTIFYVGSTYASREYADHGMVSTDRQYFAKFQYLFRR